MDEHLKGILETERKTSSMASAVVRVAGAAHALVVCGNGVQASIMAERITRYNQAELAGNGCNYVMCSGEYPSKLVARWVEWVCVCRPTMPGKRFWDHFTPGETHPELKVMTFANMGTDEEMTVKVGHGVPSNALLHSREGVTAKP